MLDTTGMKFLHPNRKAAIGALKNHFLADGVELEFAKRANTQGNIEVRYQTDDVTFLIGPSRDNWLIVDVRPGTEVAKIIGE